MILVERFDFEQDLASYNREQAYGNDRHNILTVVMHQHGYDLDEAVKWAFEYHRERKAHFIDKMNRVPSFGSKVDEQIKVYLSGVALMPRSNYCWNFESGRYFGDKGLEIQKTRRVPLLPKVVSDAHSGGVAVAAVQM